VTTAPRVSVVVPGRDAAHTLPGVLRALAAQTVGRELYEVVVVDDDSSDATPSVVRRSAVARLVRAPTHVGIAASRNMGVHAARGELIAFIDADCVPSESWLERGLALLDAGEADVLAGHIDVALPRASPAALADATHYYNQQRYVAEGFGATGNLWVRREILERVGPFDEHLDRSEDYDFGRRAVAAGAHLVYAPDVVVRHPARGPLELARRSYRIGTDRGLQGLAGRAGRGAYVTPARARDRLARAGIRPTRGRVLSVWAGKWLCIRLPMAAGALLGGLSRGHRASPGARAAAAATGDEGARPPSRPGASGPPSQGP
jgi:glycosyltransferase involved in cell wall biosynthesis